MEKFESLLSESLLAHIYVAPNIKSCVTEQSVSSTLFQEIAAYAVKLGCQTHFHWGPHQPHSCFQRAECNFKTV